VVIIRGIHMKHTIILPDLGQTTSEAKILKWHKDPGDLVSAGEPLVEVETDKATMDVEAYVGGYLRATLVEEGQMATAKDPIAVLTDTAEEIFEETPDVAAKPLPQESPLMKAEKTRPMKVGGAVAAVPAARTLARELGIDLSRVDGSGPNELITVRDVQRAAERAKTQESAALASPIETGALSAMAAVTASSKATIPHFYVTVEVDVSAAIEWRQQWNRSHPDLPASFNDIFVRVASVSVKESPQINISLQGGKYDQRSSGDVLLVVATEGRLNLVPVRDPSRSTWEDFLLGMRTLLNSAREGKITGLGGPAPLLAISNLGMYRVKEFAAIIPPGCTAILAVGSIRDQVTLKEGLPEVVRICSLTLSVDHRVADGISAAKFLERIQVHLNSL
jgi:pyruvate dehydrogenase E2 component (dihydrolipoamide acetyltransferase)